MDKTQLDELYHNLRELCLTNDLFQKEAVIGIVSHLTQPQGDYQGLLRFLSYYGEKYVLPHALKLLQDSARYLSFTRVVELGAGFAWLGRGISNAYGQLPTVFVDRRQWVFTSIVADIETKNGVKRVLDELKDGDLIVMSELIHCLDKPRDTLRPFARWPMLIVEYDSTDSTYMSSYRAQIEKFGCKLVNSMRNVFPGSEVLSARTSTHWIGIILPL